jgi:hypothetical protein
VPNDVNNRVRFVAGTDVEFIDDKVSKTPYFLIESSDEKSSFDFHGLYDVAGLATAVPVELEARRPDFVLVALDETKGWVDPVVAICGRIKAVYGVNRSDTRYSQHWMEFLSNQCERPFADVEEADIEEEFRKVNYDTMTDFERDNSEERGREIGRWELDGLEILGSVPVSTQWVIEYMLGEDEGKRFEMDNAVFWEAEANGLPSVFFENPRSDAEIIEAGKDLLRKAVSP